MKLNDLEKLSKREERPFWKTLENLDPDISVKWVTNFSSSESVAVSWCLSRLFERIWDLESPERAEYIRVLFCELQRIEWGMIQLARILNKLDLKTDGERYHYLIEVIRQLKEELGLSSVRPQVVAIGGVSMDLSIGLEKKILAFVSNFKETLSQVREGLKTKKIKTELSGVLPLDRYRLESIAWGGPVAHASGSIWDMRVLEPYSIYEDMDIELFSKVSRRTVPVGDAFRRWCAIDFQIDQSLEICKRILIRMPKGLVRNEEKRSHQTESGHSNFVWVEGCSGPIFAGIYNGRIRVSSSITRGWFGMKKNLSELSSESIEIGLSTLGINIEELGLINELA